MFGRAAAGAGAAPNRARRRTGRGLADRNDEETHAEGRVAARGRQARDRLLLDVTFGLLAGRDGRVERPRSQAPPLPRQKVRPRDGEVQRLLRLGGDDDRDGEHAAIPPSTPPPRRAGRSGCRRSPPAAGRHRVPGWRGRRVAGHVDGNDSEVITVELEEEAGGVEHRLGPVRGDERRGEGEAGHLVEVVPNIWWKARRPQAPPCRSSAACARRPIR